MSFTDEKTQFLTPKEAAEMLKVSPRSIERACRLGEIRAIKVLSLWRIPADAITELLAGRQ